MERKVRKTKFRKFIAVLCIFALLQSYFSCFAEIVIAVNEIDSDEESFATSVKKDENVASENAEITNDDEENSEDATAISDSDDEENAVVSEEEIGDENTSDETTLEEEEPIDEDQTAEEVTDEETTEEIVEESEPEEPAQEQEPYVEPEITIEVTSENSSIYKGYLYANATSELKFETNYNTIDTVEIVGGKNMKPLTIQDEPDKIELLTNTKIGLISEMYYKQTRISVEEFNTILGEDGVITLYTPEGEIVGYINKDSAVINDEYVFTYPIELNSVKVELSNILQDGKISIKNDKAIKSSSEFSRKQISLFSKINTIVQGNIYKGEEVKTYSAEGNINLEETESRMLINVDTDTLSVENENEVAITVTLKTDEERYDLFENPTIDLEFPSVVEEINVTSATLLYKNGLSIDNWEVTTNSLGRKVLKLKLSGAQLEYTPGGAQQGTTLVVYANVKANRLTADTTENLKMTYTNKDTVRKTYALEGKDAEELSMNFVGRQELVRALEVTEEGVASAISIDDKTEKIQILANQENEQTVTLHGTVLNNYEATLHGLVIVGRIPFVGNLDGNGYDLGTNFDSKLQTALTTTGSLSDVYYSEDGQADANSTSWTLDTDDVSKYKSFKIVLKEKDFAKGENVSFDYNITIPAGLGNNAVGYATYYSSYKIDNQPYADNCYSGIYTEMKEVQFEDIQDENKEDIAELTVGTQVSQGGRILKDGDSVYERQILKYTVAVSNNSRIEAKNIKLKCNADNSNIYDWELTNYGDMFGTGEDFIVKQLKEYTNEEKQYIEFSKDSLLPGESVTYEYLVIVKRTEEMENPIVKGNLLISSDNLSEQQVETGINNILDGKIEVLIEKNGTESVNEEIIKTGSTLGLTSRVKNISNKELTNVQYILTIPDNTELDKNWLMMDDGIEWLNENGDYSTKAIFNIKNLAIDEEVIIDFSLKLNSFDYLQESERIVVNSYAEIEDEKYISNEYAKNIFQNDTKMEYNFYSNIDSEYIKDNQEIVFSLNAKNIGLLESKNINVTGNIPTGLLLENITLNDEEILNENENKDNLNVTFKVDKNENKTLKIYTKLNEELLDIDQNFVEFSTKAVEGFNEKEAYNSNIITYKVNPPYTSEKQADKVIEDEENNSMNIYEDDVPSQQEQISNNENIVNSNDNNNENNSENKNEEPVQQIPVKQEETVEVVQENFIIETVYTISGKVWLDSNRDGIKQEDESGRKDEKVSLYSANKNGGIDISKEIATTTTNENGEYKFEKVPVGSYVVLLEYNSELYNITKYQVENAKQDENSDVISKMISIKGKNKLVAVTDVITVSNSGMTNIDMGLSEKNLFDLSLKQYLVKATVKNENGTKTHKFNNSTNSKIEIRSKDYKSSIVDVTYKMIVKNEGELAGYVNRIVDYVPEGMEVNLNASPGWYIGTDGGVYYNGLVGDEINPGETRELTLVLRKNLSDGEAVTLENKAEIAEYTNAYSMKDRDSTELNGLDEDDLGKATLQISVATGKTVQYIITTLLIIAGLAIIVRIIIKKKDTKKVFK